MTTVRIEAVSHSYGSRNALARVSLELSTGVTALLGPNGAGKSTLLGLLSSALRLQRGTIEIDELSPDRDARRYRESIGFLPQQFSVPNHLTCAEFLTLTAWWRRVGRRRRPELVREALEAVALQDRASAKIRSLSGGMLRRLGIAQAMVNSPRVLLLDEPTVGLDPRQRAGLREVITELGRTRTVLVGLPAAGRGRSARCAADRGPARRRDRRVPALRDPRRGIISPCCGGTASAAGRSGGRPGAP